MQNGYPDVLKLLLQVVPDSAMAIATDNGGWTPATTAASLNRDAALKLLLEAAPAVVMQADGMGRLPTYHAALKGHATCLKLLLDAAPASALAPVSSMGNYTAAHAAAHNGHAAALQQILAVAPAAAAARGIDGNTPV